MFVSVFYVPADISTKAFTRLRQGLHLQDVRFSGGSNGIRVNTRVGKADFNEAISRFVRGYSRVALFVTIRFHIKKFR